MEKFRAYESSSSLAAGRRHDDRERGFRTSGLLRGALANLHD
mgnify:CR=1 FL=1